jgi:ParB family chromosome partitioning protein
MERRESLGATLARRAPRKMGDVTSSSLVRNYQREVDRQKALVRKAAFTQQQLLFTVSPLQQLFVDENFTNLLRAEGLETLPKFIDERVWAKGRWP